MNHNTHPHRALRLAAALGVTLALMACGGGQVKPDQWPPDPALETAVVADMSDSAALLAVPPRQALKALPRARAVFGERTLAELLPGGALTRWAQLKEGEAPPVLRGLDMERPVVFGLRAPPGAADYADTVYGVTPDLTRPPWMMRVTALLPASDARQLAADLVAWLRDEGASPADLDDVDRQALSGATVLSVPDPGQAPRLVAVRPAGERVVVELLWPLREVAAPPGAVAAMMAAPLARPLPRTPGLTHFLQNRGQLGAWLNLADWAALSAWTGAAAGARYLERTGSGAARVVQMAHIWSTLLTGARAMTPERRMVQDVGLYVELGDDLTVRLVETLTERGARAYQAARDAAAPTWPVEASSPAFSVRLGYSPQALAAALGPPEPGVDVLAGGPYSALYALSGATWIRALGVDPALLGDGGTMVLSGLVYPRDGGAPRLKAGLAVQNGRAFPEGVGASFSKLLGQEVIAELTQAGDRHQARLTTGEALGDLIDLSEAEPMEEAHVEVEIDLTRLDQIPWRDAIEPGLERRAKRFARARYVSLSEGNALAAALRLVPREGGQGERPAVAAYPGEAPPPAPSGAGAGCLQEAGQVVLGAVRALTRGGPDGLWGAPERLEEADAELKPHLECALRSPDVSESAARLRSSWGLLKARVFEVTGYPERGAELARAACEAGRQGGCAVAERLEAPWEEDTLFLPSIPWAPQVEPMALPGHVIPIGLSQEGVYLGKRRLGDRLGVRKERLDELVRVELNAAIARPVVMEIKADNNILMQDIRDPLAAADDHKVTTRIVLKDLSGRDVVYGRPNPLDPLPEGHHVVWVDLLADRLIFSWYDRRGRLRRDEILRARHPIFTHVLARRGVELQKELGGVVRFRLYGAPEMPWGDLAPAVSALRLRAGVAAPDGASLDQLVEADRSGEGARPKVILLIAPESPTKEAAGVR